MENIRNNKNVSVRTRNLVTSALLASIICLVTGYILHIPTVNGGYVHIGDAIIYLSAAVLPLPYAIACSAVGAGLADLTTGAFIWVIPTMIIKPILVLFFSSKSDKIITVRNVIAAFLAGIVGITLYMVAEGLLFGNMKAAFALTAVGLIQPIGSFISFIILGIVLDKVNFKKFYNA
ncbi:TIGR04002 family protein [Intestinibacter bartlettii]|uniref:TIGR04002 family protein n=1 Tax=Intestinibacter bartlettii TaxID=261299 RepID=A0ABS6DWP5_9FIRM|nr:TIGR04002 family protein [Intestinibacter bartlettii]